MSTIRASLTDNSTKDDTDDDINGAEVDANPQYIADVNDGTITNVAMNQVGNAHFAVEPYVTDHKLGRVRVYNDSPATISDGTYLYVSGYDSTNSVYEVSAAQSKTPATDSIYATLIADEDIGPSSVGIAAERKVAYQTEDTSGLTAGRPVWLSPTAGSWTGTLPDAGYGIQITGWVVEVGVSGTIAHRVPGTIVPWQAADQI